jgi:hypothetical protein
MRGASYCNGWLQVEDWLRIICAEYDLVVADIEIIASDVSQALNKGHFRLATISFPSSGVFRDEYRIKRGRGRGRYHCYFVQGRVARSGVSRDLILKLGMDGCTGAFCARNW